jgi:hypothetical protein
MTADVRKLLTLRQVAELVPSRTGTFTPLYTLRTWIGRGVKVRGGGRLRLKTSRVGHGPFLVDRADLKHFLAECAGRPVALTDEMGAAARKRPARAHA